MNKTQKCLISSATGVIGIGILLLVKAIKHRHHSGTCEKVGKGVDEKLLESKELLEKASNHIQSIYEHLKNRKS